jgi:hypothetical protein
LALSVVPSQGSQYVRGRVKTGRGADIAESTDRTTGESRHQHIDDLGKSLCANAFLRYSHLVNVLARWRATVMVDAVPSTEGRSHEAS